MNATTLPLPSRAPAVVIPDTGDPSLFRRARTWWTIIGLFLMAQGNGLFTKQDKTYWSLKDLNQVYDSKPNLLWLTSLLWVICLALMVTSIVPTLRVMVKQKAVLAFALLAVASTLWSVEPSLTVRRGTLLLLLCAFAWFFSAYYSPADQSRILIAAGVVVALGCIAMVVVFPEYGIATTGEWKGIFGQKNRMGLGLFYLFASLPFRPLPNVRRVFVLLFQAVLPIGLILLSQSKTSLILTAILVAVRFIGPWVASRRRDQLPFALFSVAFGSIVVLILAFTAQSIILPLLGRDSSMTGRTDHWAILLGYAFRHFWLGYGYEAFWTGTGDSLAIISRVGGAMKGADSGFVDAMLMLGIAGIIMYVVLAIACMRSMLAVYRKGSIPMEAFWYAGVVIATLIGSFTENLSMSPTGVSAFVFALACAGLGNLKGENLPAQGSVSG